MCLHNNLLHTAGINKLYENRCVSLSLPINKVLSFTVKDAALTVISSNLMLRRNLRRPLAAEANEEEQWNDEDAEDDNEEEDGQEEEEEEFNEADDEKLYSQEQLLNTGTWTIGESRNNTKEDTEEKDNRGNGGWDDEQCSL